MRDGGFKVTLDNRKLHIAALIHCYLKTIPPCWSFAKVLFWSSYVSCCDLHCAFRCVADEKQLQKYLADRTGTLVVIEG